MDFLKFLAIGLTAGVASGFFGIGGGVIIVPALIYMAGFSQHRATGTSLVVLLPPVGLAAVLEYHRHGNVDFKAAIVVAVAVFFGAWVGSIYANQLAGPILRLCFGIFVVLLGFYTVAGALQRLAQVKREKLPKTSPSTALTHPAQPHDAKP